MAGSVNKVILIGNLGQDPEIRNAQGGQMFASLSVATSEAWKDRNTGERKERTEWHRVVIYNETLAKLAEQYLKKGSKVYLEGQLATRKWTDQSGQERYTTEVVLQKYRGELTLLDKLPSNRPPPADDPDSYGRTETRQPPGGAGFGSGAHPDLDDDIPF